MTTNILLWTGVFWLLTIATTADLVATVAVCKYIDEYVLNEGLNFLASVTAVTTALVAAVIMWNLAASFLLKGRTKKSEPTKAAAPREYVRIRGEDFESRTVTVRDDDGKLIAEYLGCWDIKCYDIATLMFISAGDLQSIDCEQYLVWVDGVPIGKSMIGQTSSDKTVQPAHDDAPKIGSDHPELKFIIYQGLQEHCLNAARCGYYGFEISRDEAIRISICREEDLPTSLLITSKEVRLEVFQACLSEYRAMGFGIRQTADVWTISWEKERKSFTNNPLIPSPKRIRDISKHNERTCPLNKVNETGQSAKATVDMSGENETEAAEKRVHTLADYGPYIIW